MDNPEWISHIRVVNGVTRERVLILTKTYPSPSSQYRETTCVASVNEAGELRRIFPVPFRLLEGSYRFKKWEWIDAKLTATSKDRRPESRRIDVDSITRSDRVIGTENEWSKRLKWVEPHILPSFDALEKRRQETGETLGILCPSRILSLEIKPVEQADWTPADWEKLTRDGLFDTAAVKARPPLRKLPFDFYYHYEIETASGVEVHRHKLTDWEVGALYWNCYGKPNCEELVRQKLEIEFSAKRLMFLMGTVHRFPDQWLIVGLIYPPKPQPKPSGAQLDLGLGQ